MHCSKPLRVVVVLALVVVAGQMFAATADFTGDGKPDIFVRNYSTGANAIWAMNGTAFSGIVDLPGLPNTSIVINASGDFNHDGKPDLVMRNKANGANAIWLMEGTALLQIVDLPGLPLAGPWQLKGVGDFDRDGNVDILWNNFGGTGGSGAGGTWVWVMNGTSYVRAQPLYHSSLIQYADAQGVADFDGDGSVDVLTRSDLNGAAEILLFDGFVHVGNVALPHLPDLNFEFVAVADYTGDGKVDIVLRNKVTGANAIWVMNGTAFAGIIDLPSLPDTNYRIGSPR